MAIRGIFVSGDHVITTELEHNSVLRPLYGEQEQNGISLTIVKSGKQGTVDYEGIEAAIRPETRAVICTHASNLTGNVVDLYRICLLYTSSLLALSAKRGRSSNTTISKFRSFAMRISAVATCPAPQITSFACFPRG